MGALTLICEWSKPQQKRKEIAHDGFRLQGVAQASCSEAIETKLVTIKRGGKDKLICKSM